MNKDEILSKIKCLASKNNGEVPSLKSFAAETGITRSEWQPSLWLRWSDAVKEAGFSANTFGIPKHNIEDLIIKYIELLRELKHIPIQGELIRKRKDDPSFPSPKAFLYNFGKKEDLISSIIEFCEGKNEYEDILKYCSSYLTVHRGKNEVTKDEVSQEGYVYLIQHGTRNEYKIGKTKNPIRREGEIRLTLPEKIKPIHYIKTDDPSGIEKYWHNRFSKKRKEGEWFSLDNNDINAFKRWKNIL